MGKIICISNQKGGVGKTTTTNALAMGLKHRGYRVLCVDFDPQGNLSFSLRADNRVELQSSVYHVLKGELKAGQAIQHTEIGNIIPSNIILSGIELEFTGQGRESLLKNALRPLESLYDYILIDSPPALGILTVNAFTAAHFLLIPMLSDLFSLQGFVQLHESVEQVRARYNPQLVTAGIFLTRFNPREQVSNLIRETAADIAQTCNVPLLNSYIRTSVMLTKAQVMRRDVFEFAPYNNAVLDYKSLIDELFEQGVL